ncbi:fer-1-like protein 4 [Pseudoliparis swirei]|uniref:fer-1-like protein 4 n=1 Tax=Pseudoliparis swirei TaxID=2059687 RepID=UPI0024BD7300|nr:fer-1-like protein 4 [Pseudoliparis swirei]XP_056293795.1 fer-1-like protein 4 [Pseudoliparis swirei]
MSISVNLRKISNLPGRYDRKIELCFRGFTHKTKVLQCENVAVFNEQFRWPHYGKVIRNEVLTVSVYNSSKVFTNRLLGKLVVSLQHVVTAGRLLLREPLTDSNYSLTDIFIELDIRYHPVEGVAGSWEGGDFLKVEDKDDSSLVIKNTTFKDPESQLTVSRSVQLDREVRALGRGLIRNGDEDYDDDDDDDFDDDIMDWEESDIIFTPLLSRQRPMNRSVAVAMPRVQNFQLNVNILEAQRLVGVNISPAVFIRVGNQKKHTATQKSTNFPFYSENFQFEFQETPEILFDKVIEIKVFHRRLLAFMMTHIGTFKIDISTVFNQPDHRFYQKWAPLTDPEDTRSGIKGYVKASLSVLMTGDPVIINSMPSTSLSGASEDIEKHLLLPRGMAAERPWSRFRVRIYRAEGLPTMEAGLMAKMSKATDRTIFIDPYVHVTFAGQQGETSVASATNYPVWNEEISFIEQFPPLAQRIRIQVLDDAKMGDIALATHYLDLQQISDHTRNGFNPTFGPGWVNLYGSPKNSTLGDVHQAMNQGLGEGIFYRGRILLALSVEVYSSPVDATPERSTAALGRMKGALGKLTLKKKRASKKGKNKEASTSALVGDSGEAEVEVPEAVTVEVEEIHPLPEGFLGELEDFLLFGSLFEVTMMDPSVATKPLTFELSIGNYGKAVGVVVSKKSKEEELRRSREELRNSREEIRMIREELMMSTEDLTEEMQSLLELEEELEREEVRSPEPESRSVSAPIRPQATEYDRSFQCIPLQPPSDRQKLCLFVWCQFENHSSRLYQANWLNKTADRLEFGLDEVERLLRRPRSNSKERLVDVLLELVAACKQFNVFADRRGNSRPNKLDRCRKEFIKKNLLFLARQAVRFRRRMTRRLVPQRLMDSRKLLKKLRLLAKEPQATIPDAFLWLLSGGKRLAYVRIPAYSILFSLVEEQKGRDCGRLTTLYMKSPGGPASQIFAKLEVYLWLGLAKYSKEVTNSLPDEFKPVYEEDEKEQKRLCSAGKRELPVTLSCQDSRYFQLRCHLYQGRGLMAADDNGLSDPYAKVLFATQCQQTRVLHESLSPAWCESLLFDRVLLEGSREDIQRDPPLIIINIYDHNAVSGPKFLGRAFGEPEFKFVEKHYQKPHLRYFDISFGKAPAGELLATFELIELDYSGFGEPCLPSSVDPQELTYLEEERCYVIPEGVRPVLKTFRIEVLFWGLRELKRVHLFEVERPVVRVECGGQQLESEEIVSYKTHPNFTELVRYINVELPEQAYLHPPLTLFVVEQRAFGRFILVGTHVVQSLIDYAPRELGAEKDDDDDEPIAKVRQDTKKVQDLMSVRNMGLHGLKMKQSKIPFKFKADLKKLLTKGVELKEEVPEKEELDWWTKYYASLEEMERQVAEAVEEEEQAETVGANLTMANIEDSDEEESVVVPVQPPKRKNISTLTLYGGDLESEFSQFQDRLQTFPLHKGKASVEDVEAPEVERLMGKFKGSFLVYPIDPGDEEDTTCQITKGIPKNSAFKVLVRVYIVKATSLAPSDPNGKSDPYLVVRAGQQSSSTLDRYIPKQLNPTFGEVFEFTVSFPLETELVVVVLDHDIIGADDVIGETRVDLENRFYSRHRASCGLALYYDTEGYNKWRDTKNPTAILSELCKINGIPSPEYRKLEVKVLNKIFKIPPDAVPEALLKKNQRSPEEEDEMEEHAALSVLHRWGEMNEFLHGALRLVPEHVEVRSLKSPLKPGLPQGYVHMWIDMFPTDIPAPPPVDIKPRLPVKYELRVIIWNADDVFLDDVNPFTGEPSSDIYVKGWIKGLEGDKQETDVHFNSLTGEGNFNWRFVFCFDYLPTEKEVVFKKKESFFSLEESEFRQPAILTLQVWDYDRIASNDFLGSIELRLHDMVRAAKTSANCTIQMAREWAGPRLSIFRAKKMKGWLPLIRQKTAAEFEKEEKEREEARKKGKKRKKKKDKRSNIKPEDLEYTDGGGNTFLLMGKLEVQLQLVALEQAEANPVGRARKEPEPLDKPNRPSTSFTWFMNPLKTFIFLIWKKFKKFIIALVILAILTLFLALIVYTLPQQISNLIVQG